MVNVFGYWLSRTINGDFTLRNRFRLWANHSMQKLNEKGVAFQPPMTMDSMHMLFLSVIFVWLFSFCCLCFSAFPHSRIEWADKNHINNISSTCIKLLSAIMSSGRHTYTYQQLLKDNRNCCRNLIRAKK